MSELRHRKLKVDSSPVKLSKNVTQPRSFKRLFIYLVIIGLLSYILGITWFGNVNVLDTVAKSIGYESDKHYAVIIDAGSSGSRVLAYRFRIPLVLFGQKSLLLEEEYFGQSEPGLSSYADNPRKGAESIINLIKKADVLIPVSKQNRTPLIVRATAGLRLLPQEKSDALILNVQKAINSLKYDVGSNAVEVMNGSDEGIFIWYTVNLLHGLMNHNTMAALDLGGGSTQITYKIHEKEKEMLPLADQFNVPTGSQNISVYTHSYLKLGLLAARYGILRLESGDKKTTNFTSVCVDPIIQEEQWTYASTIYTVSGAPRPAGMKKKAIYDRCHELVRKYVDETLDYKPTAPPQGNVAAMSYFYDVAADAGMIDVMKGGRVSISHYQSSALTECSNSNVDQPWACINLVYITTLLGDGYKIKPDKPIALLKKVNGHEVSWALGLAYTTLMERLKL